MTTTPEPDTYGAQLYAELRKLTGYDLLVRNFSYEAIQQLKQADRQQTLKLFQGSSYPVLQQIKTEDPASVAAYLLEQARLAQSNTTTAILISLIAS